MSLLPQGGFSFLAGTPSGPSGNDALSGGNATLTAAQQQLLNYVNSPTAPATVPDPTTQITGALPNLPQLGQPLNPLQPATAASGAGGLGSAGCPPITGITSLFQALPCLLAKYAIIALGIMLLVLGIYLLAQREAK